jgi:hypothetical protein
MLAEILAHAQSEIGSLIRLFPTAELDELLFDFLRGIRSQRQRAFAGRCGATRICAWRSILSLSAAQQTSGAGVWRDPDPAPVSGPNNPLSRGPNMRSSEP